MKFSTLLSLASVLTFTVAIPIEKRDVVWVTEYTTVYVNKDSVPTTLQAEEATQTTQAEDAEETPAAAAEEPTTTKAVEPTTEAVEPTAEAATPTTVEPSTTALETTASATSTSTSSEEFPHVGEMTYYDTGLGACGWTSTDSDYIVALSQQVFDKKTPNGNPNNNPYCGKQIEAKWGDKTVVVTVVDSCPGCAPNDLDFSPTAFEAIADKDLGRTEFSWRWIDQV